MKKRLTLLLAALLSCLLFASCSPKTPIGVDSSGLEPFVIGGIGPLSEEYARYGESVKNGAQQAVDEINATGGVNGFRLVLNFQDSKADPTTAVTVYEKLKTNDMKALLGGVFSEETAELTSLSAEDKILTVIPSAGGEYAPVGSAFRICPNDKRLSEGAATVLIEQYQAKRPTVLYCDDVFDHAQIAREFLAACQKKNVPATEILLTSDMTDAEREQIFTVLSQGHYDGILLALPDAELSEFFTAFTSETIPLVAVDMPENPEGLREFTLLSTFFPSEENKLIQNFTETYTEAFQTMPDRHAANAYDGVYAIAECIKRSGISPDNVDENDAGEKLIDAMTRIRVQGVTGTLAWTTDGETTRPIALQNYKNGEFVPLGSEENSATS